MSVMMKQGDLPDTIPLFPLTGALLLPRARLPLHIFEPRYLQMLEDCMKTRQRLIGMIQPRHGPAAARGLNQIGCAGRLTGFSETEDGRYMITLTGISRFRLMREMDGFTPYIRGAVTWGDFSADLGACEKNGGFPRKPFFDLLGRFFAHAEIDTDWEMLEAADDELLINSLAMLLPLDPEDKQALLEAPCLQTRRETLVTLMEYAMRGGDEEILQ